MQISASDAMIAPSWTVGDITVQRIDEAPLPPATGAWLLPSATPALVVGHDWLRPDFANSEGVLHLSSHTFAVTAGGRRILIDTGIGNGKTRANPAWHDLRTDYLDRLTAAGFAPDTVDLVVTTHLHTDHVGWNTHVAKGDWVPTFPNARYLTSRAEWDFWAGYDMEEPRRQMFRDSVYPIAEAGLLDILDVPAHGLELLPGLRLIPTPGHTPGQVAVELTSGDYAAVITGDCIHHPVQLPHPGIGSCVDIDPEQAEKTRRALLSTLADTGTLLFGSHFPPPTAGHVRSHAGAYLLAPASQSVSK
ncbi:MBL fold metallo-hydrolase [Nocardia pseudobrasiliensis]|uniref:Glyoxylase-like metal-dependent hydrolase (Beta-lactamase superfamily II) n=1 Tax=Nocardia pseudobrasiliensis TaxID=45979 RepID=A0A370IB87_9NOCA|nr:MBL fold metallo-hydrolase [Nocardia pseudobrasiliensis]RDI67968.1 glyoxylase-like metal-dependent hydrolase (beta-lactamase superfamily II) [Nocardia pseudobrasiliensis]